MNFQGFFAFSIDIDMVMWYTKHITNFAKEVVIMAIIYQHDKRSGITYAYESFSYWDKEKKMSRAKRKLIGRLNKETGEIVPTDGRNRGDKVKEPIDKEPDYKVLYEKLMKKYAAQEALVTSMKKELKKLKKKGE